MLFRPSESREYRGTNERPSKAVVLRTYGREEGAIPFMTMQTEPNPDIKTWGAM